MTLESGALRRTATPAAVAAWTALVLFETLAQVALKAGGDKLGDAPLDMAWICLPQPSPGSSRGSSAILAPSSPGWSFSTGFPQPGVPADVGVLRHGDGRLRAVLPRGGRLAPGTGIALIIVGVIVIGTEEE